MTAPVPFSWAPVTIRPLPSDSIRTNAPDGPGALNHQPEATPIASFGPERSGRPRPLDRPLERLERAVALVPLAGRALVAVVDEVPPAELDRVQPDPGGERRRGAARRPSRPAARSARGRSPTASGSCRRASASMSTAGIR